MISISVFNRLIWSVIELKKIMARKVTPVFKNVMNRDTLYLWFTWEKENNYEGVEYGEPLDVGVRHALQDVIPSKDGEKLWKIRIIFKLIQSFK